MCFGTSLLAAVFFSFVYYVHTTTLPFYRVFFTQLKGCRIKVKLFVRGYGNTYYIHNFSLKSECFKIVQCSFGTPCILCSYLTNKKHKPFSTPGTTIKTTVLTAEGKQIVPKQEKMYY